MFPDFHYLFRFLFGIDVPALAIFKTFGFIVALAFLAGGYVLYSELKRKRNQGFFIPSIEQETVGAPPTSFELIINGLMGFVLGFKLVGLLMNYRTVSADPLAYILSIKGNWLAGIFLAALFVFIRYRDKKKQQLDKPKKISVAVYPHQRVMDVIMISGIGGFVGAKVFNAFETWDQFLADPIGSLFSGAGLTFYGGLIVATIALYYYTKKRNFRFSHLCDSAAPALMIAYAIGRLGCQFAGDGDWGIYNSAYISQPDASIVASHDAQFDSAVAQHAAYFTEFAGHVPHLSVAAPSYLPVWTVAMNYPHNINKEGISIAGDTGEYNKVLPVPVFPTPVYEFLACSILFFIMMAMRRRLLYAWQMFGLYLILNGLERFFIEKIRVNYKYDWGFIHPTQAEIISACMVVAGLVLLLYRRKVAASAQQIDTLDVR